jgi:Dockerin type I domain
VSTQTCVPADLNCDGAVSAQDVALLLSQWGTAGNADLNGDGTVGSPDLAILLGAWT